MFFCQKLATTRTLKYVNLVKAFLKNQIAHECKIFKEDLFALFGGSLRYLLRCD